MASSSSTKIGKGHIIHSQAREILANVMQFMKEEATNNSCGIPLTNFKERFLAATKVSEKTYRSVAKEMQDVSTGASISFSSPSKKRSKSSPKSTLMEWQTQIIRTFVHNFYLTEQRRPTLKGKFLFLYIMTLLKYVFIGILNKLKENDISFEGGLSTLSKVLKRMGFK